MSITHTERERESWNKWKWAVAMEGYLDTLEAAVDGGFHESSYRVWKEVLIPRKDNQVQNEGLAL